MAFVSLTYIYAYTMVLNRKNWISRILKKNRSASGQKIEVYSHQISKKKAHNAVNQKNNGIFFLEAKK